MEAVKKFQINKIIKVTLISLVGTLLLTISAKVKIPFYPVPMTMQTFVVLFLGLAFGYKIGLATVTLYLLEGIVGLPVFANSPEKGIGLIYFTGPTMGYLIGFLVAVYFAGTRGNFLNWSKYKYLNMLAVFIRLVVSVVLYIFWVCCGWDI